MPRGRPRGERKIPINVRFTEELHDGVQRYQEECRRKTMTPKSRNAAILELVGYALNRLRRERDGVLGPLFAPRSEEGSK